MQPFTFHNPTKLIFGQGSITQLRKQVPQLGQHVLLVYGGGSIKKTGVYQQVISELEAVNTQVTELSGVEPNPRLGTVKRGIELCKQNQIDGLLAVGGGSVIDCAKAIAIGAHDEGDVWDIITQKASSKTALPLGTVLTLAATGSEMNPTSVISNEVTKEKVAWGSPLVYPKFSVLDPVLTFTVPRDQTVYGIVDIMSHILEHYFNRAGNTPIQDGFCESMLRTVMDTAPKLLENLDSYAYRETMLYSGTMALNGVLSMGLRGDWATHNIEHAVSAVYDIPHGGGLAILFPHWMRHVIDEDISRFKQLATQVFGIDPSAQSDRETALLGIDALQSFWTSIGAPSRLGDYGIGDEHLELMADKAMARGPFGQFKTLQKTDVLHIYRNAL